jgi:uncharacterized protein with HEPN domain
MNESDLIRLQHMLDYALEVTDFVEGQRREVLDQDRVLARALCYSIGIIGEAASKVSQETRGANSQISWRSAIGMRNFLFHGYYATDYDILWETATEAVLPLIVELKKLLADPNDKTE